MSFPSVNSAWESCPTVSPSSSCFKAQGRHPRLWSLLLPPWRFWPHAHSSHTACLDGAAARSLLCLRTEVLSRVPAHSRSSGDATGWRNEEMIGWVWAPCLAGPRLPTAPTGPGQGQGYLALHLERRWGHRPLFSCSRSETKRGDWP